MNGHEHPVLWILEHKDLVTPVNFSLFKSQQFCNSQLFNGKKSRESQQDEFIYINLKSSVYDAVIKNIYVFNLFYASY